MVIALALTGCGQQGEQNAGATGSESRNEAISNENNPAGEVTTEPEVNIGESGLFICLSTFRLIPSNDEMENFFKVL